MSRFAIVKAIFPTCREILDIDQIMDESLGLELTEDNIEDVLDEIRPYLVGEFAPASAQDKPLSLPYFCIPAVITSALLSVLHMTISAVQTCLAGLLSAELPIHLAISILLPGNIRLAVILHWSTAVALLYLLTAAFHVSFQAALGHLKPHVSRRAPSSESIASRKLMQLLHHE